MAPRHGPGVRTVTGGSALEPGLEGRATLVVGAADTAAAVGSGDVAVLATPRVVALCEAATVAALAGRLRDSDTSVGTRVAIDHRRASPLGVEVAALAVLASASGRRLSFDVTATSGGEVIAAGTIERVVVDRARFLGSVG